MAWVTGAAGALGDAVVRRLAAAGWRGLASGHREPPSPPPEWIADAGDLTVEEVATNAAARALAAFGRLDLAVCAAGAWEGGKEADKADPDQLERMWRINVESAWRCARAAARAMGEGGEEVGGRAIVLVAAASALNRPAPAGAAAYRAAKAAVASLAESLAVELGRRGIAVVALAPGVLDTPDNRRAMPRADRSAWVPLERAAEVIAFLATPAGAVLTGNVLTLDGRALAGGA
ncbi:MAG: SDR family oxidoreductase [Firmicutes bacterium]|nr:SDR family oxidoreductase [Bacillota bacterium]